MTASSRSATGASSADAASSVGSGAAGAELLRPSSASWAAIRCRKREFSLVDCRSTSACGQQAAQAEAKGKNATHELGIEALLRHPPILKDDDRLGLGDRAQPMGDENDGDVLLGED